MYRKFLLGHMAAVLMAPPLWPSLVMAEQDGPHAHGSAQPLQATPNDWKEVLPEDRYRVLFEEATEPARTSPLDKQYGDGTYICAACYQPLFDSVDKFDSGTGWPSFIRPLQGAMDTKRDFKLIWPRTEYHCSRCGGHQGHVFKDGPPPTGERWCNNGLALEFVPRGEALPQLRDPGE